MQHIMSDLFRHCTFASVDFTTSESMKLSQEYHPKGDRQLIAVSKIDKYDKGIEDKLRGLGPGSMSLRLGCVAVLNRLQEEIDQKISFNETKKRERDFFKRHKAFKHVQDTYK
ncbi:unnamed protein product, partial [Didymodactylos carnosus]